MNTQVCTSLTLFKILASIEFTGKKEVQGFILVFVMISSLYLFSNTMRHRCLCKFCHFSFQMGQGSVKKCSHREITCIRSFYYYGSACCFWQC